MDGKEIAIIKPHSFEKAKQHIQKFSEQTSPDVGIDKVDETNWLIFDHDVTGEEFNDRIRQIQNYLVKFNTLHTDFIKEFGKVYEALESLDGEYIPAILVAVKAAAEASDQAKAAQADIQKSVEALKKVVEVLKKHQNQLDDLKLDRLEHLKDIDGIWRKSNQTKKNVDSIKRDSTKLKNQLTELENTVKLLHEFADELINYEHLEDVDKAWQDVLTLGKNLSGITEKLGNLATRINAKEESVKKIEEKLEELGQYEHLQDIDGIWADVESHKKMLADLEKTSSDNTRNIGMLESDISTFATFKAELEKQEHLNQIDEIWKRAEENRNTLVQVKTDIIRNKEADNQLAKSMDEEKAIAENHADRIAQMEDASIRHQSSLNQLISIKHIFDVGSLWNQSAQHTEQIGSLERNVTTNASVIEELKKQIVDERNKHEDEMELMREKLKNAYYLGGGAIALAVVGIVLGVIGF